MAVKFSQFTEATDASTITKIVGYTATGSLNVQIPPANLDTTYVVSTTSGAAPVVNLTATKTGGTATSSLLNFTGSGGTTLTGTAGTSTIDISSVDTNTTYTLPAGGTSSAATLTLTGSDSSSDIVTLTGGTGITFSSITDGGFTIDAASSGGFGSIFQTTGTGSALSVTLPTAPTAAQNCLVSISGVTQNLLDASGNANWTVTGTTFAFTTSPPVTSVNAIQIIVIA
tara:strand:+ start:1587 stop:2270 length:684 start_codon:yes stop_codon:yes gene_type:complete